MNPEEQTQTFFNSFFVGGYGYIITGILAVIIMYIHLRVLYRDNYHLSAYNIFLAVCWLIINFLPIVNMVAIACYLCFLAIDPPDFLKEAVLFRRRYPEEKR